MALYGEFLYGLDRVIGLQVDDEAVRAAHAFVHAERNADPARALRVDSRSTYDHGRRSTTLFDSQPGLLDHQWAGAYALDGKDRLNRLLVMMWPGPPCVLKRFLVEIIALEA